MRSSAKELENEYPACSFSTRFFRTELKRSSASCWKTSVPMRFFSTRYVLATDNGKQTGAPEFLYREYMRGYTITTTGDAHSPSQ